MINKVFIVFVLIILALSIRGIGGNPTTNELTDASWRSDGPFELSPERGRFALMYSIIEDKSYYFSVDLARFVDPDLGYLNGHYVSLFAPGVSYIVMPGYLLGKVMGVSQVGTYLVISLFALVNTYLVILISKKLGANTIASLLGAAAFIFGTPAYPYAVSLYQHHISTFLILLSLYIVMASKRIWTLTIVWFLCAASIPIDYPNLFLMFPIGVAALFRVIRISANNRNITININFVGVLTVLSVILPLVFFLGFNNNSYGNPLQFSGTVPSAGKIAADGTPLKDAQPNFEDVGAFVKKDTNSEKSAVGFFDTRDVVNGLYIHLLSPDRGIFTFAPVIMFGLIGIYFLYKNKNPYIAMLVGIVGTNLVLYSMWGDPWGGWAFGSRYLIPSYSIISIFIAIALTNLRKKKVMILIFYILFVYSVGVNTLGALTTSANPPQVEALPLEKLSGRQERYSFDRNWEVLSSGKSKSFVFLNYASKYVNSVNYYHIIFGSIAFMGTYMTLYLITRKK